MKECLRLWESFNIEFLFLKTLISRDLESSAKIVEELKANRAQGTKQKGIDPLEKSLIEVRAQLHKVINLIIWICYNE